MIKYFDKDFFKFLLGFIAIIALSLVIILAAKSYQVKSKLETANAIQAVSTKP
jgi:hypothetical protein